MNIVDPKESGKLVRIAGPGLLLGRGYRLAICSKYCTVDIFFARETDASTAGVVQLHAFMV